MFIVFDLDDTLADTTHRQYILNEAYMSNSETWNAFFDECDKDTPKSEIIEIFTALSRSDEHRIEIWTARSERVLEKTVAWLQKYVPNSQFHILRMREEGDLRDDTEVKGDWIEQYGKPDLVFEDRNRMVYFFRKQGITTVQVEESNF